MGTPWNVMPTPAFSAAIFHMSVSNPDDACPPSVILLKGIRLAMPTLSGVRASSLRRAASLFKVALLVGALVCLLLIQFTEKVHCMVLQHCSYENTNAQVQHSYSRSASVGRVAPNKPSFPPPQVSSIFTNFLLPSQSTKSCLNKISILKIALFGKTCHFEIKLLFLH